MEYRIAIIDDQAVFLEAARAELEGSGMAVVAVGSSGDEAMAIARSVTVDALLVDLRLGDEDGVAVADRVRRATGLPVIVMSGYPSDEMEELVAGSSAIGFLSKADLSGPAVAALLGPPGGAIGPRGRR